MDRNNFMGLNGFVWFMGVVENRKDPLRLGRCQVRCFGWHTSNKLLIPTSDLPWAQTIIPPNQARTYSSPKEGDYVVGFFSDGENAQFPIIMGVLPGVPDKAPNIGQGFSDQRTDEDLKNSPREPASILFRVNGNGVDVREANTADIYPHRLNEPTSGRLYRNENVANTVVGIKRTSIDKQVPTGDGEFWDEPYPAYNATPPFNQAIETESGHAFEMDDTPGNERIHMAHRTGTFFEMYPSGTKVEKITKNNYQIILGDDMIHVMGRVNITVDSDVNILSRGNVNIVGGNDLSARIAGTVNITAGEDMNFKAANFSFITPGNIDIKATNIKETSKNKNINTNILREESSTKHMTASDLYKETVGESHYRWNDVKYMYIGDDTWTVAVSGKKDHVCPTTRSGDNSCSKADSATPPESAVDPNIPEAPYRSRKNNAPFETEPIPVPNLNVVALEEVTPELGYALKETRSTESVVIETTPPADVKPNDSAACIPIANLVPSKNCLDTIKKYEGLELKAYPDPATKGEPITIGYGGTAVALGRPVKLGDTITKEQAEADLQMIVNNFAKGVKKAITISCITQGQFDALVSFAYNAGLGNLKKSSMLSLTNIGDKQGAADAFMKWTKAGGKELKGLVTRRTSERALYLS